MKTLNDLFSSVLPQDGREPQIVTRLREDREWLLAHGYSEVDIEALAEVKINLYMDKREGWSSKP